MGDLYAKACSGTLGHEALAQLSLEQILHFKTRDSL